MQTKLPQTYILKVIIQSIDKNNNINYYFDIVTINLLLYPYNSITFSQVESSNVVKTNNWKRRQNNLNITMSLQPKFQ